MSYEIVHTFGFTVYFVFLLFFLWVSRFARTTSGAGWWAASLACALCGRLALFLMLPASDTSAAAFIYAVFIVLEKPFLLTGLSRFLSLGLPERWFWLAAGAAELWLVLTWRADAPALMRSVGYTMVNAGFLVCIAWLAYRHRREVPGWPLYVTALSASALAVHWLCAPYVIAAHPTWFRDGFVLGTMLVLIKYFSLLASILLRFQKRLVDAEAKALGLAFLDPLTGLKNKRYMETLFDHALLLATRLIVIGTQLESPDQAYGIAKKLLDQLTAQIPVSGANYALGASIGISLYPIHGTQLAELIERADSAMYQVKRNGKSGFVIYDAREKSGNP